MVIPLAKVSRQGTHVAHAEIPDMMDTLGQGRVVLTYDRGSLYLMVRDYRPDGQAVFFVEIDSIQTSYPFHADETGRKIELVANQDH